MAGSSSAFRWLDALPAAVLVIDRDGRVAHANPPAASVLDRHHDELQGALLRDLLVPLEELLRAVDPQEQRGEIRLSREGREPLHLGYAVNRTPEADLILLKDLDALSKAQNERNRLLRLATLAEILPALMHQVRNPLAAAMATLEVLIEEHPLPRGREELREVLEEVRRAAHALRGVGDMTRHLRTLEYFRLAPAIHEGLAPLRSSAAARDIEVDVSVGPPETVPLEPSVLRAMVYHLTSNAVAACGRGGTVIVRAGLDPSAPTKAGTFRLTVEDNGSGMSPTQLSRCRELFYTTKTHGSGLGLPLCIQAVESAGGTLNVSSEIGRGTRVEILLALPSRIAERS
ncbi:MAG: HAMP domain-containing histidine kinase [Myxococcales bacterium]|nr:HAMP domain-containing histidine kinase [Myxococcales bacterium]